MKYQIADMIFFIKALFGNLLYYLCENFNNKINQSNN